MLSLPFPSLQRPPPHLLYPKWSFIKAYHCHIKIQYVTDQTYAFLTKSQALPISLSLLTPMIHIKLVLGFTIALGPGYTSKAHSLLLRPHSGVIWNRILQSRRYILIYSQVPAFPPEINLFLNSLLDFRDLEETIAILTT